jgi:CRP-like cAMP-binding protein
MVSDALLEMDSTSPHTTVASLPATTAAVVQSTGPLMLGAGLALLILGGRLGGPVTGALLGGATAAWAGHTIASALDKAIGAERFGDLVMLSQSLRFVGLLTFFGAVAGVFLARKGREELTERRLAALRKTKHQAVIDQRRAQKIEADREAAAAQIAEGETDALDGGGGLVVFDEPEEELAPEEVARREAIGTILYAAPLLHSLDDHEIEAIAPAFERHQYANGHDLFREGQVDQTIYLIGRGEVQIWKKSADKPRFLLARLSPGMMFGEMAVVEKRKRSASATAYGPVEVLSLTGESFAELSRSRPALVSKVQVGLIQVLANRLRKTSKDLLQLTEAQTLGKDPDAPKVAKRKGQPVTEEAIAPMVATARLLQALDEAEVKALASTIQTTDFEDGDHIVAVGTNLRTMYLITEGRVQIWRRNEQGQKVELAILGPGDPVGEMALFEDDLRSSNATATGEVKTLRFTRRTMMKLTQGHPKVAVKLYQAFLEVLSERLRTTSAQLVEVAAPKGQAPMTVGFAPPEKPLDEGDASDLANLADSDALLDSGASPGMGTSDLAEEDMEGLEDEEEEKEEEEEEEITVDVHADEVNADARLSQEQYRRQFRTASGLAVLAALTAYWAASPPWLSLMRNLPSPATNADVPKSEPGLPNAQQPMNPFGPDFAAALEARGHERMHSRPWPCLSDVYDREKGYGSLPRKTETLAVPASTLAVDLAPAIVDMRKRGVYRMGLTGSATPPYGPLGSFLAWPAVQLLLDSPPRTAQWIKLHPRRLDKLDLLPGATAPTACALLVDEEVTVDHLYATVRSLSSVYGDPSCRQAVVLVLPDDGSTTNSHPGWRGCP